MMLSSKTPRTLKKTNKRPSSIKMASHVKNVNNIGFSNADEIKNEFCNKKEILKYKKLIKKLIHKKLFLENKKFIHEPTFFGNNSVKYIKLLETSLKVRQIQMKEGDIAQIAIGNFYGWDNLESGHPSGLDCKKKDNSIIMEIKNKYNTCNSGSQKAILDKLAQYKKTNPNTICVWAIVNPKPKCKKLTQTIVHSGVEIEKIQGLDLFKLVFNIDNVDHSCEIIKYIQNIMNKLYNN